MAKKVTSKNVATKASKILRDGRYNETSKSVAGSALSQREKKRTTGTGPKLSKK